MTQQTARRRPIVLVAIAGGLLSACASPAPRRGDAIAPGAAVWPTPLAANDDSLGGEGGRGDGETATVAVPDDGGGSDRESSSDGWRELDDGLATRQVILRDAAGGRIERPIIVRIDPTRYRFDVAYRPGAPQSLAAWRAETGAAVVVNAGYFTEENVATGHIVAAGTPSGLSYGDFAGMFAVTEAGPEVRWLGEQPFDDAEPLTAAVQSFPILVRSDGTAAFAEEDGKVARRTIVGQDRSGRIVLAVMPLGGLSLHALSEWLATADDLDLRVAFNLDGGASSGLLLPDGTGDPGLVPVPAVIVARRR